MNQAYVILFSLLLSAISFSVCDAAEHERSTTAEAKKFFRRSNAIGFSDKAPEIQGISVALKTPVALGTPGTSGIRQLGRRSVSSARVADSNFPSDNPNRAGVPPDESNWQPADAGNLAFTDADDADTSDSANSTTTTWFDDSIREQPWEFWPGRALRFPRCLEGTWRNLLTAIPLCPELLPSYTERFYLDNDSALIVTRPLPGDQFHCDSSLLPYMITYILVAKKCDDRLCSNHGHCVMENENTVMAIAVCYCDAPYRGRDCSEEYRSIFWVVSLLWLAVFFEFCFMISAVYAHMNQHVYYGAGLKVRFVDVLNRHRPSSEPASGSSKTASRPAQPPPSPNPPVTFIGTEVSTMDAPVGSTAATAAEATSPNEAAAV